MNEWPPKGAISATSAPGSTQGLVRICHPHGNHWPCAVCDPPRRWWQLRFSNRDGIGSVVFVREDFERILGWAAQVDKPYAGWDREDIDLHDRIEKVLTTLDFWRAS